MRLILPNHGWLKHCVFCVVALSTTVVSAQSLPRVLILDFKNKSGNASLGYLEGTITEAVTAEMKKRFTFRETPAEQWKGIAEKNFFFEPDYATDSAAMNLGLLTSQDVVIAGNIMPGKNAGNAIVSVGVFDIGQKKKIEQLEIPLSLSANMFADVEKIATKVSDTAASVLPNKDDWNRSGLADFTGKKRQRLYALFGTGVLPVTSTADASLSEVTRVTAESFNFKMNIQLQYELELPWIRNTFAWGGGLVEFGSQNFATNAGGSVKGTLFSWAFIAGGGWHMLERVRWRLSLLAGAGLYTQSIRFDYSSDTVFALNSSTLGIESGKATQALGIIAPLAVRFSYRVTPDIAVFTMAGVQGRFFQNSQGLSAYFSLGAGYDF
jgi:hypothetical protein